MAELPQLGERCQIESCQQLDFLPITCSKCNGIFCKIHSSRDSHGCEEEQPIKQVNLSSNSKDSFVCTFEGCSNRELIDVRCEQCRKQFCLGHRHQSDHKCSSLPIKPVDVSPQERLKSITGRELSSEKKGRTGVKNEARQLKVALMKMKMNAVGDKSIPQIERIYLNIQLPEGQKDKAMYFSKQWTAGKVIDKICQVVGLTNQNNIPSKKKLCLFQLQTGRVLPVDQTLDQLTHTEDLKSGSDVILEYTDAVQS